MMRAPLPLRTAGGLLALAAVIAASPSRTATPTADVTGVSIRSAANRAELVVDVRGVVEVSDFALSNPARLVVDLVGARLVAPVILYDGVPRAGIRNVRYAQFRPDVVRVVVELDSARDYDVHQEDSEVRVAFDAAEPFTAWSSLGTPSPAGSSRLVIAAPESDAAPAASAPAPAAPALAIPRAAAVTPTPQPTQTSQQPRISVTFDNATIQEVVAQFAAFTQRSIVLGSGVSGTVTAEVRDQPWDFAFNAILSAHGLSAIELPGGIIRVDSRTAIAAQDSLEPVQTRVVPIDYARATSLAPSIAGVVSSRGKVVPDSVTNSIIITEISSRIQNLETFIKSLDQRTPQVAIQARIIFVDRTELEDIGVRYDVSTSSEFYTDLIPATLRNPNSTTTANPVVNLGGTAVAAIGNASQTLADGNPALKVVLSTVIGNYSLSSFIEALTSVSLADLQAEPAVTVADNRLANIFSGEDTPIRQIDAGSVGATGGGATAPRATTTFKRTGIRLDVTPHVVPGTREVLMTLHAERSQVTPSAISEIGAVFSTQEANTQLLVRDGETAVIGGLTVTEVTQSRSGIPYLMDLPVVGPLFGFRNTKENRRDLLILVTPHIVDDLTAAGTGGQNQ